MPSEDNPSAPASATLTASLVADAASEEFAHFLRGPGGTFIAAARGGKLTFEKLAEGMFGTGFLRGIAVMSGVVDDLKAQLEAAKRREGGGS